MSSDIYEPKGVVVDVDGRQYMFVTEDEPRASIRNWVLYRHPDGQWVTLYKLNKASIALLRKFAALQCKCHELQNLKDT